MKKTEFVTQVAECTGCTKKDTERTMDALFACLAELMAQGDQLGVPDFGIFTTKVRAARTGRNPSTGQCVSIPKTVVPVFKPGKKLKEKVEHHEIG